MSEERVLHWRDVRRDGRRQTRMGEWIEGIKPEVHDHKFDILWRENGVRPPCEREPGDPYWEPVV